MTMLVGRGEGVARCWRGAVQIGLSGFGAGKKVGGGAADIYTHGLAAFMARIMSNRGPERSAGGTKAEIPRSANHTTLGPG